MAYSYDIQGAAAGHGGRVQQTPEERQLAKIRAQIKAAEDTNYDGDPEYYNQIKAIALQAGIPIKQFKTNPFRVAKAGLLSTLDTMALGLIPNSLYTPMNDAEQQAADIGSVVGMVNPLGVPGAAVRGVMGGVKALPRWGRAMFKQQLSASDYRKLANQGGVPEWWMNRGKDLGGTVNRKRRKEFMTGRSEPPKPIKPPKPDVPKKVRVSRSKKTPGAPMASDEAAILAKAKPGQRRYYKTLKDNDKKIAYLNKILQSL